MRRSLRRIVAVIALGGLSIGLISQGLGAQFTSGGTAIQQLNVGVMHLTLSTDNGGTVSGNTITCKVPTIVASSDSSGKTCDIIIGTDGGTIVPSEVTVTAKAVGVGVTVTPFDTGSFLLTMPGGSNFWLNQPADHSYPIYDAAGLGASSFPMTLQPNLSWSNLQTSDEGGSLTVTYTITATA